MLLQTDDGPTRSKRVNDFERVRPVSHAPSGGMEEDGPGVGAGAALYPRRKKAGIPCSKRTKRSVQAHPDIVC